MTKRIAAPLFVAVLLMSGQADAQIFHKHRGQRAVASYGTSTMTPTSAAPGVATGIVAGAPVPAKTAYPYYSYYAAYPGQARGYVGYNNDEFAFHGQAYGHPYDKWTWEYMTGSNATVLARYYDPPVK